MEIPQTTLDKFKLKVITRSTERGELLKDFMYPINEARKGTKYKPLSIARIGMYLAHIETKDLYYLRSVCLDAANRSNNYYQGFSKKFFYEIKPRD